MKSNVIIFEPNRIHFRGPGSPHDRRDSSAEIIPFPVKIPALESASVPAIAEESLTDYLARFFPAFDSGIRK